MHWMLSRGQKIKILNSKFPNEIVLDFLWLVLEDPKNQFLFNDPASITRWKYDFENDYFSQGKSLLVSK